MRPFYTFDPFDSGHPNVATIVQSHVILLTGCWLALCILHTVTSSRWWDGRLLFFLFLLFCLFVCWQPMGRSERCLLDRADVHGDSVPADHVHGDVLWCQLRPLGFGFQRQVFRVAVLVCAWFVCWRSVCGSVPANNERQQQR